MAKILIGIGGTGAKCLEAFTHLLAVGLLRNDKKEKIFSFFIDSDSANGTLERAQIVMKSYQYCADTIQKNEDFFYTSFEQIPAVWTPFGAVHDPKFDMLLGLTGDNSKEGLLFQTLFRKNERDLKLNWGFRGIPSIGASVLAKSVTKDANQPWQKLWELLDGSNENHRIFLVGSLFGGTGAAGLPTVARLIANEYKNNVFTGAALLLPYFEFKPPVEDKIYANSANFVADTQAALQYYSHNKVEEWFDIMYLMGDSNLVEMPSSCAGGKLQLNESHFIELYAGLAAIDFFNMDISDLKINGNDKIFNFISRSSSKFLKWEDLPVPRNIDYSIRLKMEQFSRFAFAYVSIFYPMLIDIKNNGAPHRAPWFVDFFSKNRVDIKDEKNLCKIQQMKSYCEKYLNWFASVQASVTNHTLDPHEKLINFSPFADVEYPDTNKGKLGQKVELMKSFKTEDFDKLFFSSSDSVPKKISQLSDRINNAKPANDTNDYVWAFFYEIYKNCA